MLFLKLIYQFLDSDPIKMKAMCIKEALGKVQIQTCFLMKSVAKVVKKIARSSVVNVF